MKRWHAVRGFGFAAISLLSPRVAHAARPPQGVLLGGGVHSPIIESPTYGLPPVYRSATTNEPFGEINWVLVPGCAPGLEFGISNLVGSAPFDFTGPFSSPPTLLPDIPVASLLQIQPVANGTPWSTTAIADPVGALPSGAANTIFVNGTVDPETLNCVGGVPAPRFTVAGDNQPGLSGNAGFTDSQLVRIGVASTMSATAFDEWFANPNSLPSCAASPVASEAGAGSRTNWPWVRTNTSCGDPNAWNVNAAVRFSPSAKPSGFDGPTLYADPFDVVAGVSRVYLTGDVSVADGKSNFKPILTSDDGGETWSGAISADRTAAWHSAMTSTRPHGVGAAKHGTLFFASCESGSMNVYWSYERAGTFLHGPAKLPVSCVQDSTRFSKVLSRVSPVSVAWDTVRIAYLTGPNAGPYDIAVGVVSVYTGNFVKMKPQVPKLAEDNWTQMSAISPIRPLDTNPNASMIRVWSVEPDGFEWNSHQPFQALPDTTALIWDEGDLRCPFPTTNVAKGAARWAMVRGDGSRVSAWTQPNLLSKKFESYANCNNGVDPINGVTGDILGADFSTGSFFYHPDSMRGSLNYFASWAQNDNTAQPLPSPLPVRQHYDVISVDPPPYVAITGLTAVQPVQTGYSLTVRVGSSDARSWSGVGVHFLYQHKHGDWRKLEDGCAHPEVAVDPSGMAATYSCTTNRGIDALRFVALASDDTLEIPPTLPASDCPADLREFCRSDNFANSDLDCVAPPAGRQAACVPQFPGGSCAQGCPRGQLLCVGHRLL